MGPGLRKTSRWRNEDINPLEGAINIVDAMLVFACGLMLALAINWNVDLGLGQRVNLEQGQAIDNPQIRENLIETQGEGSGWIVCIGYYHFGPAFSRSCFMSGA